MGVHTEFLIYFQYIQDDHKHTVLCDHTGLLIYSDTVQIMLSSVGGSVLVRSPFKQLSH
jgi:hypothetical protein